MWVSLVACGRVCVCVSVPVNPYQMSCCQSIVITETLADESPLDMIVPACKHKMLVM